MHAALRKGPLFYKTPHFPLFYKTSPFSTFLQIPPFSILLQNSPIFHFFYKTPIFHFFTKTPPHFISCLRAWSLLTYPSYTSTCTADGQSCCQKALKRTQNFTMTGVTVQPKIRTATNKVYVMNTQCRCV